jgi:AraC-like DNA-binding protein
MTWDRWTAEGAGKRRLDRWQDLICREMLNVDLKLPNPNEFRCSLSRMGFSDVRFIRFRSTPHSVERTSTDKSSSTVGFDHFMISAQLSGLTRIQSGKHQVDLRPGDVGVLDASRPFTNQFIGTTSRAVVLFDKSRFKRTFNADSLRRMPTAHPYFRIVRQHILSLADPTVDHDPLVAEALIVSLIELMTQMTAAPSASNQAAKSKITRRNVESFIRMNISRADLTLLSIAAEFGVSLRSLFTLYEDAPMSLEQTIISIRLQRAAQILASGEGATETVTSVSTMVGFKDSAHFSRRFRDKYGKPPSDWRMADYSSEIMQ